MDPTLPTYSESTKNSPAKQLTRHTYSLSTGSGKPYATLIIKSLAGSPESLPYFLGNTVPIAGEFILDLDKPEGIKSIVVTLRGKVIGSLFTNKTFFSISKTLWPSPSGDTLNPGNTSNKSPFNQVKLQGEYKWPFSFELPDKITFSEKETKQLDIQLIPNKEYTLPPSRDSHFLWSPINYEIGVDIRTSGFFSSDSSLYKSFIFAPVVANPEKPLTTEKSIAQWFKSSEFELPGSSGKFKFIVPSPLSYVRGTVLPVKLIPSSENSEMDVSKLSLPFAELARTHKEFMDMKYAYSSSAEAASVNRGDGTVIKPISTTKWDTKFTDDVINGSSERVLTGELLLPKDLQPTYEFGIFNMIYTIDLYSVAPGTAYDAPRERLCRVEIVVTTA